MQWIGGERRILCAQLDVMKNVFAVWMALCSILGWAQVPTYVPTDGLVGWYPLDGNGMDVSAFQVSGQVEGAVAAIDRFGEEGLALAFDGDDLVRIENATHWPSAERTTSIWLLATDLSWGRSILTYGGGACGTSWNQTYNNQGNGAAGLNAFEVQGHCNVLSTAVQHPLDTMVWHHLVMTTGEDGTVIYLDGVELGSSSQFMDQTNVSGCALLGGMLPPSGSCGSNWVDVNNSPWVGALDDFGIWDRVLTSEEIAVLFVAGVPVPGCLDAEACNYDVDANYENGSCSYDCLLCQNGSVWDDTLQACVGVLQPDNACGQGTTWDEASQSCIVANPSDTDFDGCVSMTDLLDLLTVFGTCAEEDPEVVGWSCGDPLEYQGYDYETVQIGEQCWFAENLRVNSFRNGDEIPDLSTSEDWSITDSPAFATNFSIPADRFYNWHAVLDERSLCPVGWHMPFQGEVELMIEALGGHDVAGIHLKAGSGWLEDGNGSNSSGFNGLPRGEKLSDGSFDAAGYRGYWWLQPFLTDNTASMRLKYNNDYVVFHNNIFSANSGRNVRCTQDSE